MFGYEVMIRPDLLHKAVDRGILKMTTAYDEDEERMVEVVQEAHQDEDYVALFTAEEVDPMSDISVTLVLSQPTIDRLYKEVVIPNQEKA